MKLITAIAALALLAGSVDVETQLARLKPIISVDVKPGAHQKAPEGAETGHPHIAPVARLAVSSTLKCTYNGHDFSG